MPEVWISPEAGGRLTPEALLHPTGSVDLHLFTRTFPREKYCIFHISDGDFWFNLGFIGGELIFQRGQFTLTMSESFFRKLKGNTTIIASWEEQRLILLLGPRGFVGPSLKRELQTPPYPPPASLVRWCRERSLSPVKEYGEEAEFVSRVHSGLASLQTKIDAMHMKDIFWDIVRNGNCVVERRPKRETDVHGAVHALLSDHFFLASIDVLPEVATGAGNLDFLFNGAIRGGGVAKVCAEFKLAHSPKLYDGIEFQLPAYMRAQGTDNGTYCILDYRGEWFDKPTPDSQMHVKLAMCADRGWSLKKCPIKVHHFYLGRSRVASNL